MKKTEIEALAKAIGDAVTPKWFEISNRLNIVGENVMYAAKETTKAAQAIAEAMKPPPAPPPTVKLCKDCRHCVPDMSLFFFRQVKDFRSAKCGRPAKLSLVEGTATEYCNVERKTYGSLDTCRESARYFEPKERV